VETRDASHNAQVVRALAEAGFAAQPVS
jgi:hypothetical protein